MSNTSIRPRQFILMIAICAALMYLLSYLWHGVFLNDYSKLRIPMWLYFSLSAVVYLVISLVLNLLYRYMNIRQMSTRGLLIGASVGFFIYLIAFVMGVSFGNSAASHIAVDFIWQMIEQGIGGASLGLLYGLYDDVARSNAA